MERPGLASLSLASVDSRIPLDQIAVEQQLGSAMEFRKPDIPLPRRKWRIPGLWLSPVCVTYAGGNPCEIQGKLSSAQHEGSERPPGGPGAGLENVVRFPRRSFIYPAPDGCGEPSLPNAAGGVRGLLVIRRHTASCAEARMPPVMPEDHHGDDIILDIIQKMIGKSPQVRAS